MSTPKNLAPCGTIAARRRHKKHGETCEPCTPKPLQLQPCGTPAAYKRHYKNGETPCEPCHTAHLKADEQYRRRKGMKATNHTPIQDLIDEILFLLHCGEGEHAILKATGYQTRPGSLRDRLQRHGRTDLYNRITNYELAA